MLLNFLQSVAMLNFSYLMLLLNVKERKYVIYLFFAALFIFLFHKSLIWIKNSSHIPNFFSAKIGLLTLLFSHLKLILNLNDFRFSFFFTFRSDWALAMVNALTIYSLQVYQQVVSHMESNHRTRRRPVNLKLKKLWTQL